MRAIISADVPSCMVETTVIGADSSYGILQEVLSSGNAALEIVTSFLPLRVHIGSSQPVTRLLSADRWGNLAVEWA